MNREKHTFNSLGKNDCLYKPLLYDLFSYGTKWLGFIEPSSQNVYNMSLEDGDAVIEKARVALVITLSGIIRHSLAIRVCFLKEDNVSWDSGENRRSSKVLLTLLLNKRVKLSSETKV